MSLLKRIRYDSPVVLTFALASLAALALNALTGGGANALVFSVYRASPLDPLTYVRLFGHVLGHAGWSHYLSNMTYLLLLGPMLEEKYGSRNLLLMMLATAVSTGLVFLLFFPGSALLGASGIVFLFIALASLAGYRQGELPLTTLLVMVLFLGQELYQGLSQADNISQLTHLVGAAMGYLMGIYFYRKGHGRP